MAIILTKRKYSLSLTLLWNVGNLEVNWAGFLQNFRYQWGLAPFLELVVRRWAGMRHAHNQIFNQKWRVWGIWRRSRGTLSRQKKSSSLLFVAIGLLECTHRVHVRLTWWITILNPWVECRERKKRKRSKMTLNYRMIVARYPNQTKWLVVRFLAVKSSLYLMDTSQLVKCLICFKRKINNNNNGEVPKTKWSIRRFISRAWNLLSTW